MLRSEHDIDDQGELRDMRRRAVLGAVLTVPITVLALGDMVLPGAPIDAILGRAPASWLELALSTPVVLWCASPLHKRAVATARRPSLNMFSLIAISVLAVYGYSALAVVAPDLLPPELHDARGGIAVYFVVAALVVTLALWRQVRELRARWRLGEAMRGLFDVLPRTARRVGPDGAEVDVPLESVVAGDRLRITWGETIPVDGEVVGGHSFVFEALIVGAPLPKEKAVGDTLLAGTLNGPGDLWMLARKVGHETLLARIVQEVGEARRSRAPM